MSKQTERLTLDDRVITTKATTDHANEKRPDELLGSNKVTGEGSGLPIEGSLPIAQAATPATAASTSLPVTLTRSYRITPSSDNESSIVIKCLVQIFGDRVLMCISQTNGRIGNYLLCQAEPSRVKPSTYDYETSNLLGSRHDPLLSVYAKRIAEVVLDAMPPMQSLALILGISLNKDTGRDPDVFRTTVDIMAKLYVEALGQSVE
ncbi:hypothetical protein ACA910_020439 [Epithemia clementina (nom. ined.)]